MEYTFLFIVGFVLGFLIGDKITQWYKKRLNEAKEQLSYLDKISKV